MHKQARRRLKRLLEDMIELRDTGRQHCGFGLLRLVPLSDFRLPLGLQWALLEEAVDLNRWDGNLILRPDPWFDASPTGRMCVRWWGDRERAERLVKWAERALVVFTNERGIDVDVGSIPEPTHYCLLAGLIDFAKREPALADYIRSETVLDTSAAPSTRQVMMPGAFRSLTSPVRVVYDQICGWAEVFALKVVRLLGRGLSVWPRLAVDVKAGSIKINGRVDHPDVVFVHILHQLLRANGRPMSRRDMQERSKILAHEERLDRKIAIIRQRMKINIKTVRGKGYVLSEEYFA
jgi:hypothetical protein